MSTNISLSHYILLMTPVFDLLIRMSNCTDKKTLCLQIFWLLESKKVTVRLQWPQRGPLYTIYPCISCKKISVILATRVERFVIEYYWAKSSVINIIEARAWELYKIYSSFNVVGNCWVIVRHNFNCIFRNERKSKFLFWVNPMILLVRAANC